MPTRRAKYSRRHSPTHAVIETPRAAASSFRARWSPGSTRPWISRRTDLYRGVVVWNRIRKRDVWGLKRYLARPEDQWMRRDAPELRIVDDALWTAAHRRLEDARASYLRSTNGKLNGRAPAVKAIDSKYLLTGFAQCAVCGGSLMARSRDSGSTRKFGYLCGYHHQRGRMVCVNGLEAPMEATDHAVLASIERDLLRREVVERAIEFAIDELRPGGDQAERRRDETLREMRRLDGELLSRLTAAVASGGDLPALLAALKERQAQRERCERALIELDATARIGRHEIPRLEREIRHRLADWRAMLRREVPEAREILRNLVVGRIAFKPRPEARVYEFSGRGSFGRLLAGTTSPVSVVTPAGPDRFRLTVPLHHLPAGGVKALLHRDRQRIVHGLAPAWILEASSLWSFVAVRVPLGTFIHNGIVPDSRGRDHRLQRGLSSRPLRPWAGSRPRAPGGCPATPSRHRQDRLRTDRALEVSGGS